MFENTIANLKKQGLITNDDIVVACRDASKIGTAQFWGGAIAAAVAQAKAARFILAANAKSIRLFDVDNHTGEYLGTCAQFMKNEIVKLKISSIFGTYSIVIKGQNERVLLQATKKFYHFLQKEELKRLKLFFKENY